MTKWPDTLVGRPVYWPDARTPCPIALTEYLNEMHYPKNSVTPYQNALTSIQSAQTPGPKCTNTRMCYPHPLWESETRWQVVPSPVGCGDRPEIRVTPRSSVCRVHLFDDLVKRIHLAKVGLLHIAYFDAANYPTSVATRPLHTRFVNLLIYAPLYS